jgi:ubiquinone/menaquinone biosynthesis C-methylase UbiE
VENLTYPNETFDLIFIKAAVHHFEQPFIGLKEIYRVLKPGGKLVCFEEPICLNVPLYKTWKKNNNCIEERAMGINEHIYTISEYYSFGAPSYSNQ